MLNNGKLNHDNNHANHPQNQAQREANGKGRDISSSHSACKNLTMLVRFLKVCCNNWSTIMNCNLCLLLVRNKSNLGCTYLLARHVAYHLVSSMSANSQRKGGFQGRLVPAGKASPRINRLKLI